MLSAIRYPTIVTTDAEIEAELERQRLLVVIATIVINVIAVSLLTSAPWSRLAHGRRS